MRILKNAPQLILLFIATLIASCTYEPVDGSVEPYPDSVGNAEFGVLKQTLMVIPGLQKKPKP